MYLNNLFKCVLLLSQIFIGGSCMAVEQLKTKSDSSTYNLGRFIFEVPNSMELKGKQFILGYAEVEEILWKNPDQHIREREAYWNSLLDKIRNLEPPDGIKNVILEHRDLTDGQSWKMSVLYHSNRIHKRKIRNVMLGDLESYGLRVSIEGSEKFKDAIDKGVKDIFATYKKFDSSNIKGISAPKFALEHGYFGYPFDEAEKMYLRFEGHPLKLKVEIKTEVVKEVEKTNLVERLGAALATNFAPGVTIDKIRTGSRKVADMDGDEVIMRGTEGGKSELSFAWRHNGKKLSTTAPKFTIEMESKDGQLDEKLAIWDAILDSIQVLPQ